MIRLRFTRIILLLALLYPLMAQASEARVYLDISSPDLRKVPMAVPFLLNKEDSGQPGQLGREMASLLSKGLEFHGFISVAPPGAYGGGHDILWQNIGIDFVVLGQYRANSSDITVELRLLNVLEDKMIFGKRYSGPREKHKEMVLKFCDEVILQLTGERGISLSRIAFVSDASGYKEVYLADVLGENIFQVTKHKTMTVSPRFSPDGNRLAYTSYHPGNPDLYVTDLSQTKTTRAISRRKGLNLAPAWSPDGKKMIITLSKDGNPDLYLMDTKGVILKRLTRNAGINVSPAWSPDGKKIAFVSDRSGSPQIYIMNLRNGKTQRLTYQGRDNTEPTWSPKGDMLAYSGLHEGNYHLFTIRPEGGQPTRLTKYWGDHESPSWSPDGRQIVFARRRHDEQKICAILANGTGLRTLFRVNGHQSYPQWSARVDL